MAAPPSCAAKRSQGTRAKWRNKKKKEKKKKKKKKKIQEKKERHKNSLFTWSRTPNFNRIRRPDNAQGTEKKENRAINGPG